MNKVEGFISKPKRRNPKRTLIKHSLCGILSHLDVQQKIPTERKLAQVLSTSRETIRVILKELEEEHIIRREQGSGTFLVRPLAEDENASINDVKIGVVLPSTDNLLIRDIASGISAASRQAGFITAMRDIGLNAETELKCLREMSKEQLQGLIIYPFHMIVFEEEFIDFIRQQVERGLPVVLVDRYLPQVDTYHVIPDYFQSAYILTRHLIMLGHRAILNLSMARTSGTTGMTSLRGYKQALQDYGISYREELVREREAAPGDFSGNAYSILKEFISKNSHLPFTAIYCDHKGYVYGAYRALKEHGLKIPEDIAIVSKDECNDSPYNTAVEWTFTEIPWEEIGRRAVELIKLQLSDVSRDIREQHIILPPRLIIGESCGTYLGHSRTKQKSDGSCPDISNP